MVVPSWSFWPLIGVDSYSAKFLLEEYFRDKTTAMWERIQRRYTRLFFILGGVVVVIDQVGRIETVAELYKAVKTWLSSESNVHLTWPPHILLAVGVFFIVLGLISFVWPKDEAEHIADARLSFEKPGLPNTKTQQDIAPHIDLILDLPKSYATGPGTLVRDQKIRVVNTSDTVAYDVSIQSKESDRYKAEFETIARLEKGDPAYAVMDLRAKPSGTCYSQFEALLKFELEDSSDDDNFNVRVPLIVRFHDDKKKFLYETTHEVVYNGFWCDAHIRLIQGTKSVETNPPLPDTSALVNTGPGPKKLLVKRIMRGTEKLIAWEIVRENLPKCYFVEFSLRDLEPDACISADFKVANERWHEWYKQWKQQPGGFGGASGDGLDGSLPW